MSVWPEFFRFPAVFSGQGAAGACEARKFAEDLMKLLRSGEVDEDLRCAMWENSRQVKRIWTSELLVGTLGWMIKDMGIYEFPPRLEQDKDTNDSLVPISFKPPFSIQVDRK